MRGKMQALANLHGTARVDNGGGVTLTYAAAPEPGGASHAARITVLVMDKPCAHMVRKNPLGP